MAQHFKEIRTKGVEALSEMSTELNKLSAIEAAETPKNIVAACKEVERGELNVEFVGIIANKVAESRKEILSGVSKGAAKICKNVAA
ncbi:hypothetical protein EIP86_010877 [Pleurotus ostreatoroseus]|nr:hypothetical protein EIP86_010877 [Pleurotus ostreatoroseus]